MSDLRDRLNTLLIAKFDLEPGALEADQTLESLGLDSLDIVKLTTAMEGEFGVKFDEEELMDDITLDHCWWPRYREQAAHHANREFPEGIPVPDVHGEVEEPDREQHQPAYVPAKGRRHGKPEDQRQQRNLEAHDACPVGHEPGDYGEREHDRRER